MKKNMGMIDRALRVVVAVIIAWLYYTGTIAGAVGITLLVFAGVFVLTSLLGFCPLYAPFGISTCEKK
jgi:uncharacterized membrane protein